MGYLIYQAKKDGLKSYKKRDKNSDVVIKFKKGSKITVKNTIEGWMQLKAEAYKDSWVKYSDGWERVSSSTDTPGIDLKDAEAVIQVKYLTNESTFDRGNYDKQWIVIHNTEGFSTADDCREYFNKGSKKTSSHYITDDKCALKIVDEKYIAHHAGNPDKTKYGGKRGAENKNCIGIEICDTAPCNIDQSVDNAIELTRYLMKKFNIDIEHVIRHHDVSGKICPWYMMKEGNYNGQAGDDARWTAFKDTIKQRNNSNTPIRFNSYLTNQNTGNTTGGETLPNFDNRENWEWTESWDGVILNFAVPRNYCSVKNKDQHFGENGYDREYHYICDSTTFEESKNPNYIVFSMEDNDRNTYIQNALFGMNKAVKHTVSVCMFIDPKSTDFEKTEKKLIQNLGQIMYKLGLNANWLWREFDLNRFGSPFIYLERDKWKLFLDEVHKQIEWRIKKYGEPENIPKPVGPPAKELPSSGDQVGTPGYIGDGVNIVARFTSYCPFDNGDPTSGKAEDCKDQPLRPGDKVLATPNGKKLYGKRAMIYGTGVKEVDGQIYEIKDVGPAIVVENTGRWVVDILAETSSWANNVIGNKPGYLRIEASESELGRYKPADKKPEDFGFNIPINPSNLDIKPREPEEPEEPEESDGDVEDTDSNRDLVSSEHYFEIEEIEADCPVPETVMTQKEVTELIEKYGDPRFQDIYVNKQEPWDKEIKSIRDAFVTDDDRLASLDKKIETLNENTFNYNVIEASPGGGDSGSHCIQPSAELNILAKPDPVVAEPIYPDLTIIPNYSTTDYNTTNTTKVPVDVLNDSFSISKTDEALENEFSYDYDLLKDKKKESKGKPVNYGDPYPFDDKVHDLENHAPKIKIDEIELKLYECNHPGCPVAQPVAKSISALAEAHLTQSKKIEKRLARIENVLATITRNFGRLGSRVNINCVYYGGQSTFGKYKCIRCLKDDRINDGMIVTIDQCLYCTRYEPILGQVYDILDETGLNGSMVLDDMQLAYMNLDDIKNLNSIEKRSSKYNYSKVNSDFEDEKYESLYDKWKKEDYDKYVAILDDLKAKRAEEEAEETEEQKESNKDSKEPTENQVIESDEGDSEADEILSSEKYKPHEFKPNDSVVYDKDLEEIKEEDYMFRMDWTEFDIEMQEPDIKPYPIENIKAKYKVVTGDKGETEDITTEEEKKNDLSLLSKEDEETEEEYNPDMDYDADLEMDKESADKLKNGEWVDTREVADTREINKYTSEDFYYEGFNINRAGSSGMGGGAAARAKIIEMAYKIVQEHKDKKACYSQDFRTVDYDKPQYGIWAETGQKVKGYDCSSFVSCCYKYAGLPNVTNKTSGSIRDYCKKTGVFKRLTVDNLSEAIPGDIIWRSGHVMVYTAQGEISHSSGSSYPYPKEIRTNPVEKVLKSYECYLCRPDDLVQADQVSSGSGVANGGEPCSSVQTSHGALPAVWLFRGAVCSCYGDGGNTSDGSAAKGNVVAAHNLPFGTKIYIPKLDGKGGGGKANGQDLGPKNNGVFRVADNGGPYFDFDIHSANLGKVNLDVYILEWGSGKCSWSITEALQDVKKGVPKGTRTWYPDAWKSYLELTPKLLGFTKFKNNNDNAINKNDPLSSV